LIWCTHRTVPEIASVITMARQPTASKRRRLGVVAGARGKSDGRFGSDRRDKVRGLRARSAESNNKRRPRSAMAYPPSSEPRASETVAVVH
jgi:hypothetical protein